MAPYNQLAHNGLGETWLIVEGVKDASRLYGLGYLAAGLPGSKLNRRFAPAFAGVHVVLVPDRDIAGVSGAEQSAAALQGVAASICIAELPSELKHGQGEDVRDILKRPEGEALVRKAIAEAKPWEAKGEAAKEPPAPPLFTQMYTSAEFLALDLKPRFLVRGILVAGQPGVVGGRSKAMKTSVTTDLVVSLGSGTEFLGRFPTVRSRVAFWSGESGAPTIRETALRIAAAKGIDLAACDIHWSFAVPKLSLKDHLAALGAIIREKSIEVAVLDPLYLALLTADSAGRSSDLFFMGSILQPISEIGQETGCTFELLHHFRKNSPSDDSEPAGLEELAQSGAAEWCRQWILLQRRSPYQQDGRHELWMRAGGSAGHAGLWGLDIEEGILNPDDFSGRKWEVSIRSIGDTRNEVKREKENRKAREQEQREAEHHRKLLDAMKQYPAGETERVLRGASGLNADNFGKAIRSLLQEGKAVSCEVQKIRGTYDGYCLKN